LIQQGATKVFSPSTSQPATGFSVQRTMPSILNSPMQLLLPFLPSVSYIHKSGLGFSATGYVRGIDATPSLYQMALSPSYDHIGEKSMFGVSYTYYNIK